MGGFLISMDEATKKTVQKIPLLKVSAGPKDDPEKWKARLKEEYTSIIKYIQLNKELDNDWFNIESNEDGTRWWGKVWFYHNQLKYEFELQFDVSALPSNPFHSYVYANVRISY